MKAALRTALRHLADANSGDAFPVEVYKALADESRWVGCSPAIVFMHPTLTSCSPHLHPLLLCRLMHATEVARNRILDHPYTDFLWEEDDQK